MSTPRLCIDARAMADFPGKGLITHEVLTQLTHSANESDSSEWITEKRCVLIAHPDQLTPQGIRRFETSRRILHDPLYWWWERKFVRATQATLFHRFRPVDCTHPSYECPTVTTLLPAKKRLPFFLSRKKVHHYVVPSQGDGEILIEDYQIAPAQIHVFQPSPRGLVHQVQAPAAAVEGGVLFLIGAATPRKELRRLRDIIKQRFGPLPHRVIKLEKPGDISGPTWTRQLSQTKLCVYLQDNPFDWATLALECLFWQVPTLFSDGNQTLRELLPQSSLQLSRFLLELKELDELKKAAKAARAVLEHQGIFSPTRLSRQYAALYRQFPLK